MARWMSSIVASSTWKRFFPGLAFAAVATTADRTPTIASAIAGYRLDAPTIILPSMLGTSCGWSPGAIDVPCGHAHEAARIACVAAHVAPRLARATASRQRAV